MASTVTLAALPTSPSSFASTAPPTLDDNTAALTPNSPPEPERDVDSASLSLSASISSTPVLSTLPVLPIEASTSASFVTSAMAPVAVMPTPPTAIDSA